MEHCLNPWAGQIMSSDITGEYAFCLHVFTCSHERPHMIVEDLALSRAPLLLPANNYLSLASVSLSPSPTRRSRWSRRYA